MSDLNQQIILAALTITGSKPKQPVKPKTNDEASLAAYQAELDGYDAVLSAYDQDLKANARSIRVMLSPESSISKQLNALDKAIDRDNDGGKVFVGTVVGVTKESSSTRGIVTLYTGTDQTRDGVPAGCETIRTDRTDSADGRAMARAAQLLIGHRVTVYVELEAIRGGQTKVRVLRHVESNGVDPNYDAQTRTVRPAA